MKIAIGSDHGGFKLKQQIAKLLKSKKYSVKDFGTDCQESCDYPLIAFSVAKSVARKDVNKGILICKTGIGNCIAANKVKGIRAALCYNIKAAELSRRHNDSNILVLGALFTNIAKAREIIKAWLNTDFEGGRHLRRIKQIERIEKSV
ncbi:MAG: ribose 5-phosphate isomerase B [Candidatus Omnitrophica bacterium]|nr:ribose 5-phosphate isomerase B [Candidatus Omnitrophota bacterium]MDD5352904.1 ribose 5-phosphate isomerase B [Candidatus Omnitrophota bacterium]MDD5550503.1 ribose 5-phosphate isomerase B [Candidatus Omnitrophota bacterium]